MATLTEISNESDYTREGFTATRVFQLQPYSVYPDVAFRLLGGVRLVGGRLVYFPPARHPLVRYAYCSGVKIQGVNNAVFGDNVASGYSILAKQNGYSIGLITATYKTQPTDPTPSPGGSGDDDQSSQEPTEQQEIDLAEETWDFGESMLSLPGRHFKWEGRTDLLSNQDQNVSIPEPRADLALTRHFCVRLPKIGIRNNLGRVNKQTFRILDTDYPPETMRFVGASAQRKVTNEGIPFYTVTYKFSLRSIYDYINSSTKDYVGWNRLYNPDVDTYERPVYVRSGVSRGIFELDRDTAPMVINGLTVRGFNQLFNPGAF